MTTITLKNIPDSIYADLKQVAKKNRRSINSEVLVCLEKALKPLRPQPEERLAAARKLRGALQGRHLDPTEIAAAIEQGRP